MRRNTKHEEDVRRLRVGCAALLWASAIAGCSRSSAATREAPASSASAAVAPASAATAETEKGPPSKVDRTAASATPTPSAQTAASSEGADPLPVDLLSFNAPLPAVDLLDRMPAMRYAHLEPKKCEAELGQRHVPYRFEELSTKGKRHAGDIATPLRLDGSLRGVTFRAPAPPFPFGLLDCRLAVALDDMSRWLERYSIVGVRVDNMYRPGAIIAGKNKPSQHARGLAIDILAFGLTGGGELLVKRDWHGALGKPYCGPDAVLTSANEAATKLRNLTCNLLRSGIFHHAVTPSDNRAHRDHLHFDLDPTAKRVRVEP